VSINNLRTLEKAFPNYFADTALFAGTINAFIQSKFKSAKIFK
jgi:hypothetical protein